MRNYTSSFIINILLFRHTISYYTCRCGTTNSSVAYSHY